MAACYRVRFRLASPLATPLHSGTLFGTLCWAWRYLYGEQDLARWLCSLPESPFLLSDGFPAGFVPRPLLKPAPPRRLSLEQLQYYKRVRKVRLIPREMFLKLRKGMDEATLSDEIAAWLSREEESRRRRTPNELEKLGREIRVRLAHNRIDRITGRTPEAGGLFFTEELWTTGLAQYHDLYVRTDLPAEKLRELFHCVGRWGYGKDATWGRGRFDGFEIEQEKNLVLDLSLPRAMSLSHGSLTEGMSNPRYQLETHYGRVGGVYSSTESPFKFPLILLRPGATFDSGPGPFGELLDHVHPTKPWVRQNAWHFAVSFREAD